MNCALRCLTAVLFLTNFFQGSVGNAQPSAQTETTPAALLYELSASQMKKGRNFEKCIANLREAIRQEPENAAYHSALACALAGRGGAFIHAFRLLARVGPNEEKYKLRLSEWQTAQSEPENPLHHQPRPLPFVVTTPDDDQPLTLTFKQTKEQYRALFEEALREWEASVRLAKPEQVAQMQWVRGGGLLLVRQYREREKFTDTETPEPPPLPTIIACFTAVTNAEPENALYWQGLGDAYLEGRPIGTRSEKITEALDAYKRSLVLKRNAALSYRLYEIYSDPHFSDQKAATTALRTAVQAEPANAFLWHRLAAVLLKQTRWRSVDKYTEKDYQAIHRKESPALATSEAEDTKIAWEGVAAMERGNQASDYTLPTYKAAISPLLLQIWFDFGSESNTNSSRPGGIIDLATGGADFAKYLAQKKQYDEAVRIGRDLIIVGNKLMDFASTAKDDPILKNLLFAMYANMTTAHGYQALGQVCRERGDQDGLVKIRAESEASQKNIQEHRVIFEQARKTNYNSL